MRHGLGMPVISAAQWKQNLRLGMRLVWREPIAAAITLAFYYILVFSPQTPDMFAGMTMGFENGEPKDDWWRPLSFHAFAITFGVTGWYWTRAALMARLQWHDDALYRYAKVVSKFNRWEHSFFENIARKQQDAKPRDYSPELIRAQELLERGMRLPKGLPLIAALEFAPNASFGFVFSMVLVVGVLLYPSASTVAGVICVLLARLVIEVRSLLGLAGGVRAPDWAWQWRTTAIFAAAPGGWPLALVLMMTSLCGAWLVAEHPGVIEHNLHAPAAALAALTLLVGPLVVALGFSRDVFAFTVFVFVGLYRRLRHGAGGSRPRSDDSTVRKTIPDWTANSWPPSPPNLPFGSFPAFWRSAEPLCRPHNGRFARRDLR